MINRSPVPSARALLAREARVGDLVAGHTREGDFAFEVVTVEAMGDDRVEITLVRHHATDPVAVCVEAVLPLVVLTRHFGRCTRCGRLAPCPDDLAERRLERLWDNPRSAAPVNLAPLALCP